MRKSNQQELVLQHNTGIPASIIKPVPTAFVSTYPPRRCGIATFTHDLISSIAQITGTSLGDSPDLQVIAMNNIPEGYEYPHQVRFEIRDQHKQDYREAADFINVSAVEIVSLQHEYGIFGGDSGAYILTFLRNLHKPVVTTLHTVLQKPNPVQKKILTEICELSTRVVVLSEKARELLHEVYGVPLGKIDFIHHGVPDVPFLDPAFYKDQFDLEGRLVMLTFGLINPNKGIEYAIDALAQIVDKHPEVAYIVLGATHPEVKRHFGEEYRLFLNRKVKEKGLEDHVFFHNRFVTHDELIKFLILADVYLTPYLSKEQIASGTLAYAIGCGKAVISTPYWYAEEMLADERGRLVPFKDAEALAAVLDEILSDEITRNRLRKNAYTFGRNMIWRQVAIQYLQTFQASMEQYARVRPRPLIQPRPKDIPQPSLPEINLSHMKLLTDDTGILQHAKFTTPDRFHGYTTDDNARALLVTALHWDLFSDETILPLMHRYLSFLHYAFHEKHGRFRNFMSFDRKWLEEIGSEDCQGRALWALGTVIQFAPTPGILRMATYLFEKALPAVEKFKSLRGHAAAILGCTAYLQRFSGASEIRRHLEESTEFLLKKFRANHSDTWIWWEDVLTYDNARLPQALIVAGHILKDQEALETGLRTLKWLLQIQTNPATGYLSLIGNDGWAHKNGDRAHFDQQPLDAGALVEACYDAYLITDEPGWYDELTKCFHWFFGENDIQEPVYDFTTGGCRDGLQKTGVNENQGAESTLAWLIALHKMHALSIEKSLERTKTPLPVDEEAEIENEA